MEFLQKGTRKPNDSLGDFPETGQTEYLFRSCLSFCIGELGCHRTNFYFILYFLYISKICIGNSVTYKIPQAFRCFT